MDESENNIKINVEWKDAATTETSEFVETSTVNVIDVSQAESGVRRT